MSSDTSRRDTPPGRRRGRLHSLRPATPRRRPSRLVALLAIVGIVAPFTQVSGGAALGENLLSANQNGFESGTTGVVAQDGASISSVTTVAYAGSRSLRVQSRKSRAKTAAASTTPGLGAVPSMAGVVYSGSAQVRSSVAARTARCQLDWYRADGAFHSRTNGAAVSATSAGWKTATCNATAPAGSSFVALRFEFSRVGLAESNYVDDARITAASVPTEPIAPAFAYQVSAGAFSDQLVSGTIFSADKDFLGGSVAGPLGGDVVDTTDDALYQKHRWGMTGYTVPVPAAGAYTVRLHFAEMVFPSAGYRVFDVSAENQLMIDDLDVAGRVGPSRALVLQFTVNVDNALDLRFGAVVEDPMVSGIEVLSGSSGTTPAPASTTTTAPASGTTTTTAPATTTTTAPPATTTTTAPPATTTTTTTTTAPPPATTPPAPTTGFPNATNTGVPAGTVLRASGSITTASDGQVIDAMDVTGRITVVHDNVTVRRTRIRQPGGEAIWLDPNRRGLVIEDCELDGSGNTNGAAAVVFANYTIRRCNIHHFGEGLSANGNTLIEDNYMHDFSDFVAGGAHQDGIQMEWGSNQVVRHNTILMNVDGASATIAVSLESHSGIRIENNLVAGSSYTIRAGAGGPNNNTDIHVVNNRISTVYYPLGGYYGPWTYTAGAYLSGNVWHETGLPVT